jgi:hypothetical protein
MLWEKKLELVSMGTKDGEAEDVNTAARILEIFLDALLAFSTDSHSYLLADEYLDALTPAEKALRAALLRFATDRTTEERDSAARPVIEQALADLGLAPNSIGSEKQPAWSTATPQARIVSNDVPSSLADSSYLVLNRARTSSGRPD